MADTHLNTPRARYQRRADLLGVELLSSQPVRGWDRYVAGFELVLSTGVQGRIWHRGREVELCAGHLLLAAPGDVLVFRRIQREGGLVIISIDAELLASLGQERSLSDLAAGFRGAVVEDASLERAILDLREAFRNLDGAEQVQRQLGDLLSSVVERTSARRCDLPPESRGDVVTARMRDWVHADTCTTLDLQTLANWTGLSRFQVVRAFKRKFGLPPHAYRLRSRLSIAKSALCHGMQPARVAAECGFTDQSHLTRHFKRVFGVTPAHYARLGLRPPNSPRATKRVTTVAA